MGSAYVICLFLKQEPIKSLSLSILGSPLLFVLLSTHPLAESNSKRKFTSKGPSKFWYLASAARPQVQRGWRRQHGWHGVICDVRDPPDIFPMLCGNWYSRTERPTKDSERGRCQCANFGLEWKLQMEVGNDHTGATLIFTRARPI